MEPIVFSHADAPSSARTGDPAAVAPAPTFQELAQLAARLARTAHAAILLENGAWHETMLPDAAGHRELYEAVAGRTGWVVIPDLRADPRLAGHPQVTGAPFWRFLARAPLRRHQGGGLGSLCLLDPQPRVWSDAEEERLESVVALIAGQIEWQRAEAERDRLRSECESLRGLAAVQWQRRLEELQRTNEELRAFTHSVAHELGGPLRALAGFSRMLRDAHQAELHGEAARLLELVVDAAGQMRQLTDDLLAFSRFSEQPLRKRTVDTAELVRQVAANLPVTRTGGPPEIRLGALAPCQADPGLLRQVFVNLLQNAVKFSAHREPAVIDIGCLGSNRGPVYYVRDRGVGFPPEAAERLFRPFERLHSREQFEGSGVGLSIVKRIVERHGGHVWAEGQVDQGATFFFHLGN